MDPLAPSTRGLTVDLGVDCSACRLDPLREPEMKEALPTSWRWYRVLRGQAPLLLVIVRRRALAPSIRWRLEAQGSRLSLQPPASSLERGVHRRRALAQSVRGSG